MTARDAYFYNAAREARNRVVSDDTLSLWEKSRIVANMDREFNKPAPDGRIPFSSVVKSLVGGTIGYAGAALGSRLLGMSGPGYERMKTLGFGLGALMNSGIVKSGSADVARDRERAFTIGFVKRAYQRGYFKQGRAFFAVTPQDIVAVPRGAFTGVRNLFGAAGGITGAALSPSSADAELSELEVEEKLLRDYLVNQQLTSRTRKLQELLRRRRGEA